MKKITWITIVFSALIMGCEKEADVTLPATPGRLIVEGRVEKMQNTETFLTIKDHKEGFPHTVSFCLINPKIPE